MGSSSKQSNTMPTGSTVSTPQLPSYMQPYISDVLARGQELSYQPYTPYQDQRIAGFTPGQIAAQQGILGLQPAGQFNTATQFATQAGLAGLGAYQPAPNVQAPQLSQYTMGPAREVSSRMVRAPQMTAAQTGFAPNLQTFQMEGPERVAAERASTGSFVQPGVASQYMSPYMQNVVDVQKQEAIYDAQKAQLGQNLAAARQGTYGGARQALLQGERESALSQKLGDIQATGSQAAYEAAQRQFEAEQGRGLQAQQTNIQSQLQAALSNQQARQQAEQQNLAARLGVQELGTRTGLESALANLNTQQQANVQNQAAKLQAQGMNQEQALRAALANQQAGLTIGQQNLAALLGVQELGAQQGMQAGLANQQAELEARRLGLTGAGMGLDAAQTLGGLGTAAQQAELQRYGAISGAGAEQQALRQQQLDMAYQDFLRQQQYPMQQLQQYASLLGGVPSPGPSTVTSTYSQPASLASQLAGLGLAGYGAYKTFNSAKGGEIKAYNNGGLVALAEGGGAEQQMGLGAIAPQDVAAPSVEGLGKQARDLVVSTRGNVQQINALPGVDPMVKAMAASMVAEQMRAPQPPDSTVAQKLLNTQPQMPSAGLASAPLPDNAFTAAEGGIVGYQSAGEVKATYTLDELRAMHRKALADRNISLADALQKEISRRRVETSPLSQSDFANRYAFPNRERENVLLAAPTIASEIVTKPRDIGYGISVDPVRGGKTLVEGGKNIYGYLADLTDRLGLRPEFAPEGFNEYDPNAPTNAKPVAPAPTPATGLPAIPPTTAPAPQVQPAKEEPPVDYMARAKELFAGVPSASMSPEELAARKKQRGFEAFMKFGADLAGSKGSFLEGLTQAAGATAPFIAGISKEQRDEETAGKKEAREMAILQIQTALNLERDAAEDLYKQQELSVKKQEIEANREIQLENLMLRAEAAVKASGDAQLDRRLQVLKTMLLNLSPGDPKYTELMNELKALGGYGTTVISVTAPDGTTHPFPTQEAADQFKKAIGVK